MPLTIIEEIALELKKAKAKHPRWPQHIVSRAAIVGEEAGELLRACIQFKYEDNAPDEQLCAIRMEAIQTAAMAIRFLENLETKPKAK